MAVAEKANLAKSDFLSSMYAFAGRVGPDDLRAIAAQLYVEMLEAGYTQVCELDRKSVV